MQTIIQLLQNKDALPLYEIAQGSNSSVRKTEEHLTTLINRKIIIIERHGGHTYYRLNKGMVTKYVCNTSCDLTSVESENTNPFNFARTCYGHLAGKMGVYFNQTLFRNNFLTYVGEQISVTQEGIDFFGRLGLTINLLKKGKPCLDRTERCYHLGGELGKLITTHFIAMGWLNKIGQSRIITISPEGINALGSLFP